MIKLILIVTFLSSISIFAKLERITINPKNRVNLYFNNIPIYKSELSGDKKNVFLYIDDNEFVDRYSQISGSGIIKYVTLTKINKKIKAQIELSTQRGYTAIPLPFTNSILVEAFSWDGIEKEEDTYREALLAYEVGSIEQTKELLNKIAEGNNSNAKAILGLILMKEGQIVEASKYIFEAHRDSSNIEDLYAAMAEIFKWKGLNQESLRNDSLFRSITKLESYPSFAYNGNPEELVIPNYYYSNQEIADNKEGLDTTISDEQTSSTFLDDYEEKSIGELLGFSDGYIIFVIIIVILCLAMLYYIYNKWKKGKIQEFKDMTSNRFQEEVRQARKKQKDKIEEQQKKNEEQGIRKKEEDNSNIFSKKYVQDEKKSKMDNIQQFRVKPTRNVKEITNKEQLEKFLTNYIPLKRIEETEKEETKIDEDIVYDAESDTKVETNSPDVNLALRLAEEKNRLKQKQLLDLAKKKKIEDNQEYVDNNKDKLDEDSENEEKNKEIKTDEELLSKLNKKFNVDNSNEKDD